MIPVMFIQISISYNFCVFMHSNHATKLYYSDESCKRSENNFVFRDKNNIKSNF